MSSLRLLSAVEQVAEHLREEILSGRWSGTLPGVYHLSGELSVNHKTVGSAIRQLEREGLLEGQGAGRNRRIVLPAGRKAVRSMRVGFFYNSTIEDRKTDFIIELRHALAEAGHLVVSPRNSLLELKMDVKRIARLVRSTEVDAWVVYAGSREVLRWFAAQPEPAFALAGRLEGVSIAGTKPNMPAAHVEAAHRLAELGHRRVVLLCRDGRRLPEPGRSECAFLEALEAHGIQTGKYNLPDWEGNPEGLQTLLESLFQVTPPTALLIDEAFVYTATAQFLSRRGIRVPEDVSLACTWNDPTFSWCRPSVAHIDWDPGLLVRRVVRWAANVSRGREDINQNMPPATFVEGGSIGPASALPPSQEVVVGSGS